MSNDQTNQTSGASQSPPQSPILKFFNFSHLPEKLQKQSQPFHTLASHIETTLPAGPEKTTALRKLLEAKDCAVRAAL